MEKTELVRNAIRKVVIQKLHSWNKKSKWFSNTLTLSFTHATLIIGYFKID